MGKGISKIVGDATPPWNKWGTGRRSRPTTPLITSAGRFDSDVRGSRKVNAAIEARGKVNKSVHCAGVLGSGPRPRCRELL